MALVKRRIDVTFVLGEGDFGLAGSDTVKISGLRVAARINAAGGNAMGTLECAIYGMTLSKMNQLSTLGMIATQQRKNSITVEAGDEGKPLSTVFQGTINNAWSDMRGAPETCFRVTAATGLLDAVAPTTPLSFEQPVDVANVMASLATKMGLAFENNGVNVKLPPSYWPGSPRGQALAIVQSAGIKWNGGENGTLAIWPADGQRGSPVTPINPSTGMIGYPAFNSNGIMVEALFQPTIGLGGKIEVTSDLTGTGQRDTFGNTGANGTWVIYAFDLDLNAQIPNGAWKMNIQAAPVGLGPVIPGR